MHRRVVCRKFFGKELILRNICVYQINEKVDSLTYSIPAASDRNWST